MSKPAEITAELPPAKHDRISELDLLRFVAATLVVLYHYSYRPVIDNVVSETAFGGLQAFTRYGYLGVQLFFLISGFVILWSAEGRTAVQFMKSRFLRLYPMFWVGVAITLAVLWSAGQAEQLLHVKVIAANLTLVPGYFSVPFVDGVYWTLTIELKFYVLVLMALLVGQMSHIERWMYAWFAMSIAATFTNISLLKSFVMLPHGLFFVGGAICYLIRSRGLTPVRFVALIICAGLSVFHEIAGRTDFTTAPQLASPLGVALIIVAFYLALFAVSMKAVRLPAPSLLYWLGALTYPLYLLHNMTGKVIFQQLDGLSEWPRLGITLAIAYLLAWVCARFVEPRARGIVAALITRPAREPVVAPDSLGQSPVNK